MVSGVKKKRETREKPSRVEGLRIHQLACENIVFAKFCGLPSGPCGARRPRSSEISLPKLLPHIFLNILIPARSAPAKVSALSWAAPRTQPCPSRSPWTGPGSEKRRRENENEFTSNTYLRGKQCVRARFILYGVVVNRRSRSAWEEREKGGGGEW